MSDKIRIDRLLYEKGLCDSRQKASELVKSGAVFIGGKPVDKAGSFVDADVVVEIKGDPLRYVSRGGLKLEKAVKVFDITLDGAVAADVGASTGGFTDCMLQNGAAKVYAIDVGHGQLSQKLRDDARIVVMDGTNIRNVMPGMLEDALDFASIDVSFISLGLVLPHVKPLMKASGLVVALIKPQFEAGREKVGKKGVVKDPKTHIEVIHSFLAYAKNVCFSVRALSFSPVRGPEGNIEYLAYLACPEKNEAIDSFVSDDDIERLVISSHKELPKA